MGNSFTCISHEQEQRPKKSSGGGGSNSGKYKYVRRLSLMPSFRRRTLLPSLSCSGSSSTSSSKKGGIKAKTKKIRERHHQDHHGHDKDSHIIQEQTLAATNLLFNQTPRNSNSVVPPSFRRSTSVVYPSAQPSGTSSGPVSAVQTPKKSTAGFVRSSSSRQRSSTDPMIKPNQLVDKASTSLNRKLMNLPNHTLRLLFFIYTIKHFSFYNMLNLILDPMIKSVSIYISQNV